MKRFVSVVLSILMAVSVLTLVQPAFAAYEPTVGDGFVTFDYNQLYSGTVNNLDYVTAEKNVEFQGRKALKITPKPLGTGASSAASFSLDCHTIGSFSHKVDISKYKYVGVTYYYDTDNPSCKIPLRFRYLPGSTKVTNDLVKESTHPITTKQWTEAYFSFTDAVVHQVEKPYLAQIHFRPFGTMKPTELSETDVIYISTVTFYETNPDKNYTAAISFNKGNPGASGEMADISKKPGEKLTLPEPAYTFEEYDAVFEGWECSLDGKIYKAGEEYSVVDNVTFKAQWKVDTNEDFISLLFPDYAGGTVNNVKTGTVTKTEFEGRRVVKATPDPKSTESSTRFQVEGAAYANAGIDLDAFKWFAVEYKYVAENPKSFNMTLRVLKNGNILSSGEYIAASEQPLVANQWSIALFDFTGIDSVLAPDSEHILRQMHVRPFGNDDFRTLASEGDSVYISRIMFFRERPEFVTHKGYMTGYTDATFKPNKTMTRAEACTVVARLLDTEENIAKNTTTTFSDVAPEKWYAKYISFCEAKGLLKSYSGTFLPEQNITRAEFAELVYNMGLAKEDPANAKTFADVTASHPKYTAIMAAASAGLIGGYSDGTFLPDRTITRAQVVTIINRAKGISRKADEIPGDIYTIFADVDGGHWAFADIAEATVDHVELGDKGWVFAQEDPSIEIINYLGEDFVFNIAEGNAMVKELDELEAKRIDEIRNTPSMDLSNIKGTKYYVSPKGNDANDGKSEATPFKTIKKGIQVARNGDAILLERGGLWRERGNVVPMGVTLSAYGTGAKPTIYGSPEDAAVPEKWSLVYKNDATGAKIWKYANTNLVDVGTLVFNHGEGYAMKEIPTYINGEYVVRSNKSVKYDYTEQLDKNFEFFHRADSAMSGSVPDVSRATGPLYFRCDNGNPGEVFDSIELNIKGNVLSAYSNATIDNVCIMYGGNHGIGTGSIDNFTVTNCEIGWIGGSIQSYNANGNTDGSATRFGNGVEVYGSCDGYVVDNCYIYQCYDAGVTHQASGRGTGDYREDNVTYSNNVITDTVYSIEYFLGLNGNYLREGKNILFEGNLLRRAGYGFGSSRPDGHNQGHIRSGSGNQFENFVIKNNIFDRSVNYLVQTTTVHKAYNPRYEGNTYIAGKDNLVYNFGVPATKAYADVNIKGRIANFLGDKTGKFYFVENIPYWSYTYTNPKVIDKEYEVVDDTSASASEPEEVLDPYTVRYADEKGFYGSLRDSMKTEVLEENGVKYLHITPVNVDKATLLDVTGITPALPLDSGKICFKLLVRTNYSMGKPLVNMYTLASPDGTSHGGNGVGQSATKALAAKGEWEEVYITNNSIDTSKYATCRQLHIHLWANNVRGTAMFNADGTEKYPGAYIDIAAWGVFPNETSARAYDLLKK